MGVLKSLHFFYLMMKKNSSTQDEGERDKSMKCTYAHEVVDLRNQEEEKKRDALHIIVITLKSNAHVTQ